MLGSFKSLVLITGCQRSGTTLLGQIVGAHPNAFMIDETDGLYKWFDAVVEQKPEAEVLWQAMLVAANGKYRPEHRRLEPASEGETRKPLAEIDHLVIKAPNLLYRYRDFAQLTVPVSVIYPVRDPRAVVASMTKLQHISMVQNQVNHIRHNDDLAIELADDLSQLADEAVAAHIKRAIIWRIKSTMQDRFETRDMPVLSFRYEDFVADLPSHCRRIAEHVGLEPDPAMLSHELAYRGFGPGMTERARPVDRISLANWSERLTPDQKNDILTMTSAEMKTLGYVAGQGARSGVSTTSVSDSVVSTPLIFAGRGGSGTRLLSDIAEAHDVFLGNRLNGSRDSVEWVDLIYEMVINHENGVVPLSGWGHLLHKKAETVLGQGNWRPGQPWGWKLPETMVVMPEVFKAFPNAKLIHLVRHPVASALRRTHMTSRANNPVGRAVIRAAYKEFGRDTALIAEDEDYMHNAITWLYQVGRVVKFARKQLPPEQYLEIKFEDVIARRESVSAQVSDFTGLSSCKPLTIDIKPRRAEGTAPQDERADRVWQLCETVGKELGYTRFVPELV